MPKRFATISAVEPMESFTTGSVSPRRMAITGARLASRNFAAVAAFWPNDFAAYQSASQFTIAGPNISGAWLIASVPPARTRLERPAWMFRHAVSIACMPEAQLRITVHAGTFSPQPRRSDITRPMLASSADGIAAPTMTSSNAVASKGWRARSGRPAATARSAPENGPSPFFAFRNGVRAPSTT